MKYINNYTFDEIKLGQKASFERTLTQENIDIVSAMSGDHVLDGIKGPGATVAHQLWIDSLLSNLLSNNMPGPGTTYLSQNLSFLKPIHLGDTVRVTITVEVKGQDGCTIELSCAGVNQHKETVLNGAATVLAPKEKMRVVASESSDLQIRKNDSFNQLFEMANELEAVPTAVVHPCSVSALQGALEAAEDKLITPILIGPKGKILQLAQEHNLPIGDTQIIDVEHSHAAAERAVELVRSGEVGLLMKGSLHTDELMGAVVSSSLGIRTERRVSHVFVMDVPSYPKLLLITDAAINIAPDLDEKRDICQNAIELAHTLGVGQPKVAILSAVEVVEKKIPSTIEAAALCKMADRGQITGAVLDGPLAMDNAINLDAARIKGIKSEVAGNADILLAPDMEAGNMLAKQLIFLSAAEAGGIVLGARVPIILTSRADSVRSRKASCAIAVAHAHAIKGTLDLTSDKQQAS